MYFNDFNRKFKEFCVVVGRVSFECVGRDKQENYRPCQSGCQKPGNDQAVSAIVSRANKDCNSLAQRIAVPVKHNLDGLATGIFHQVQ